MGRRTLKTLSMKNPFSERTGKQKNPPLSGTREVTCFICDGFVIGKGVPLLMNCTPYSNTQLPSKIGQLMGDGFMVIVAVTDILCKRCSSLLNQLDKLECDVINVKKVLTELLYIKYHLNDDVSDVSCNIQCDMTNTCEELEESSGLLNQHSMKIKSGNNDSNCDTKFDVTSSRSLKIENFKVEESSSSVLKTVNFECVENDNPHCLDIYIGKDSDILCDKSSVGLKSISDSSNDTSLHCCKYCSFSTSVLLELTSHMKIHSKQEFFKCLECQQKFETCSDLECHMEVVHDASTIHNDKINQDPDYHPTGKKIFKCNVRKYYHHNNKVFDSHNFKRIKQDKFTCNICLKVFKHRVTLKKHILNHQSFKCNQCSSFFQNKISLTRHIKIHSIKDVNKNKLHVNDINLIIVNNQEDACVSSLPGHEEGIKNDFVKKLSENNPSSDYDKVEILLEKIHSDDPKESSNLVNILSDKDDFKSTNISICGDEVLNRSLQICSNQTILDSNSISQQEYKEKAVQDNSNQCEEPEDSKSGGEVLTDLKSDNNFTSIDNNNDFTETDTVHKENSTTSIAEFSEKNEEKPPRNEISKKVFVCSLCGLRTSSESHIKRHFKCHIALERKTYKCHICEKVLTTHSNLKRHVSLHETCEVGAVECNMCNEVLTDRLHLKYHMEIKHPESYQCSLCDHEFENKKLCREHELLHPTMQCDVCQKIFSSEGRLKSHKVLIHNETDLPVSRPKIFKCHICLKILTTYHNLKRHLQNHEKYSGNISCMICNEELADKLHLRQHVEEKHPENHQCSFCHKVFLNRRLCKAHEMTHSERFVYKCEFCEKLFLTEARLKRHQDIMHRDPHCRICGKEIINPLKLLDHERRHQRHKSLFSCDQCPKVFRTPSGLKYHMSVHTGKYAVYCEICGKGLHSEVVLEEHKATHTKEIRYTCEKCGRTFSSNSTYRMHRLWHDNPLPYKCDICDRKFKHTSILAVHKRRAHTGERPYKCPHCSQTFSVSSTLNKHIILHTKEYPYRCEQCDKGFTTRTKIARHMAKIHDDFEMLNAKKKTCEYKMVLHPSEFSSSMKDSKQETLIEVDQIINEEKGVVEDDETNAATLQVLENVTVDPTQEAIFTIFQQDFPKF